MTDVLGYSKCGAQGGDWGNAITRSRATEFPGNLVGIHLNGTAAAVPQSGAPDEEQAWQAASAAYRTQECDYFNEQQRKPATVAFALYDNPVGAAAWIIEKFKVWSDSGTDTELRFTKRLWFYRGNADDRPAVHRSKATNRAPS